MPGKAKRKPIAITIEPLHNALAIVCNDGSIWTKTAQDENWIRLPDVPQDGGEE